MARRKPKAEPPPPQTPGEAIRAARKAAGLTQLQLARKAGTSQQSIARLESGSEACSIPRLERIAAALGCPADALKLGVAAALTYGPISRRTIELAPCDDGGWIALDEQYVPILSQLGCRRGIVPDDQVVRVARELGDRQVPLLLRGDWCPVV